MPSYFLQFSGTYTNGITLTSPPYVNPIYISPTGIVTGPTDAFYAPAGGWTVINAGSIGGNDGAGLNFNGGSAATNKISGTITGTTYGVRFNGGESTLDNAGWIHGGQSGVALNASGTITNNGYIGGSAGVGSYMGGAVYNNGTIVGHIAGVYIDGGSFSNDTGALVTADTFGVSVGDAGSVANAGTISADTGILLNGGGTVTNDVGGTIAGGRFGIDAGGNPGTATVYNAGTIVGMTEEGVVLENGGALTNAATGLIEGQTIAVYAYGPTTIANMGTISSDSGIGIELDSQGNGTIANMGTIDGSLAGIDGKYNPLTVANAGAITGTVGVGVDLEAGGMVSNAAGGSITGGYAGVAMAGTDATVDNGGTIAGTQYSVFLNATAANRLIVDAAAVFDGRVVAANATAINVIELESGAMTGTITGIGSDFTGFQTIQIDGGAAWDIVGTTAGIEGSIVQGFNNHDTLDLSDLNYADGDTVTFDSATDLLTILDGSGGTIGTVQLTSAITGTFHISGDGGNGMDITETLNQISGTHGGIDLTGSTYSDPVTVTGTGVVAGGTGDGLYATTSWTVDNAGTISGETGVDLQVAGSYLTNEAGGVIESSNDSTAVYLRAGTIINDGSLAGSAEIWSGGKLVNDGTITGGSSAVFFQDGGSITNASEGLIEGGGTQSAAVTINGTEGTIDNQGTILGVSGVSMNHGGQLTNAGTIAATNGYGVQINAAAGVIYNSGTISGLGAFGTGLALGQGDSVSNAAGATITGSFTGIQGGGDSVDNHGTIASSAGVGVSLDNGGDNSVINAGGGSIYGVTGGVVVGHGAFQTVENAGTITGGGGHDSVLMSGGNNRLIIDAGAIFNGTVVAGATYNGAAADNTIELKAGGAGTISGIGTQYQGFETVTIDSGAIWTIRDITTAITLDNAGTVNGGAGVYLQAGGAVTNEVAGDINGTSSGLYDAGYATVVNFGTIEGTGSGSNGVGLRAGGIVINSGTISGRGNAIYDDGAGSVTNQSGGLITNNSTAGPEIAVEAATVINFGSIAGGISVNYGGGSVYNSGIITGSYGISDRNGGGSLTIDNSGTIDVHGFYGLFGGIGVSLHETDAVVHNAAGGSISGVYGGVEAYQSQITLDNHGAITSADYYGVGIASGGGIITNERDGTISGAQDGIAVHDGTAVTIENAGTITGGAGYDSVYMYGAANALIIDAGAVFNGDVVASATYNGTAAVNTIELTSHAASGELNGLGTKYQGFQSVTIDSGARWEIAGTEAGIGTTEIVGFHAGDRLDITDLGFSSGETAAYGGGLLTIENAAHMVLDTLSMSGDFTGHIFSLLSDGHGGTFIEEDGTPCYCAGTLILTDRGEVPVEELAIGDALITLSGAAKPIRWIGRRSYSGRFAAGRRDILPICFKAGSLADGVPRRDLWVSPLHAMFLDGMLFPAEVLVNGTSVVQSERIDRVEYFHLELDVHDVILAEGALSETFIDDDSRGMFHNAPEFRTLYPDAERGPARFCAPRVEDGWDLEAVRRRIAGRIGTCRAPKAA